MHRPLRELPRVNYNEKVQQRLGELKKHISGKPQKRYKQKTTMEEDDLNEFLSPRGDSKDMNDTVLTTVDDADFQNMEKDELIRKLNKRRAKLLVYEKQLTDELLEQLSLSKAETYYECIKDQIAYLEAALEHIKSMTFTDVEPKAINILANLYTIEKRVEKALFDIKKKIIDKQKTQIDQKQPGSKHLYPKSSVTPGIKPLESSTPRPHITTRQNSSKINLVRQRVELLVMIIERITKLDVTEGLREDKIRSIQATDLPKLEEAKANLTKLFDEFIKQDDFEELCSYMLKNIGKAEGWIQDCQDLIKEARLDITDDSRNHLEPIKLKPFDGWKSENDIFLFMEDFNRLLSSARTSTKLAALYKNYLTQDIVNEVEHLYLADDYSGMVDFLISKYGNIRRILDSKKRQLHELKYNKDVEVQIRFFRAFHHVLLNLEALIKKHSHDLHDLSNEIYNQSFLLSMAAALPDYHKKSFIKTRSKEERKLQRKITEKEEFQLFKTFIAIELSDLEIFSLEHGNQVKNDSTKEEKHKKLELHTIDVKEKDGTETYEKKEFSKTEKKPFEPRKVAVKCPMHDLIPDFRSHQVGKCKGFLDAKPKDRFDKIKHWNMCTLCLGDWCGRSKNPECINIKLIPKPLICKECDEKRNVLICYDHSVKLDTISEHLDYLNGFDKGSKIQINHVEIGLIEKNEDLEGEVAYDVSTGKTRAIEDCGDILESQGEPTIYLFQMLNIAGRDCLTMYDSGSSGEAIEGEFAETVGFKCIDPNNQRISVAGGATITTGYGVFRCILGPLTSGRYVNKTLMGLKQITQEVKEHNLQEINQELLSFEDFKDENLPEMVGGMTTKLLIGIGSTELFPEKILELPSGLMVHRAKIADKFGSTIVFGGPHKLFGQGKNENFYKMTILFTELYNSYQNSLTVSAGLNLYSKDDQDLCAEPIIDYRGTIHNEFINSNATAAEEIERESNNIIHLDVFHPAELEGPDTKEWNQVCAKCAILELDMEGNEQVEALLNPKVGIYKVKKPIKQLKTIEEDESMLMYSYRCSRCQACIDCLSADKTKMLSVQEQEEDKLIESSVRWEKKSKTMYCSYPWIQEPTSALRKLWGKNSNDSQALAIYKQQVRKPASLKKGAIKFHNELIEKGFVAKVSDLNREQQKIISESPVNHIFPWRVVFKMDSISTPTRIVTDPSITHFNDLCAKGSNQLSNLYIMLVNFRTYLYTYSFDISKMYNTVRLEDKMLPYSLYYMSTGLEPNEEPELWCFLTLIYGLICAGNIAMYAVRFLAERFKTAEPEAHEALTKYLYMDDGFSGKNTIEELNQTIESVSRVLPEGGFKIKCMSRSGVQPSEKASSDGTTTGLAGYLWLPEKDYLKLGVGEINFNKKSRGYRIPNENPIVTSDDLNEIIPEKITRRIALGKTAEFWDIIGILEPLKVKFKINLKELHGYDWDDEIPKDLKHEWVTNFHLMSQSRNLQVKRSVIPSKALNPNEMTLIVTCDASVKMCSTSIYARYLLKDGSFSCNLLTAKSCSVDQTIPRNELSGMVLAAETTHTLLKMLDNRVKDYICCTDSTIGICWIGNQEKLLKQFCFNRVRQCHRLVNKDSWRHISGVLNPADLATKGDIGLEDLSEDSIWFTGYPWMKEDLENGPLRKYEDICDSLNAEEIEAVNKETIIEPQVQINLMNVESEPLVDFVKLGFPRAFYRLSLVLRYINKRRHKWHIKLNKSNFKDCKYCTLSQSTFETPAFKAIEEEMAEHMKLPRQSSIVVTNQMDNWITWNWIHLQLTKEVKASLSKSKLEPFIEHEGILYSGGRLSTLDHITTVEDLNSVIKPFYQELRFLSPVALITNPIVYSLLLYLHISLNHCGIEKLVSNMHKLLYVEKLRPLARKIRIDCTMCRIKLLKGYRLMIQDQSRFSYTIAPPFYACQIDIISKFKAYDINVRSSCYCHILILVCCLTQAVSLHVMESYNTESVISALTRHSSRFGWPKYLLPDEGAQLLKLSDLKFDIRDLQLRLWEKENMILDPCNPKSHSEHGKVESRIGCVRDSLKTMIDVKHSLLGWETIFASISSVINSIPITRGNDDRGVANHEFDLITPFLCILGHNSNRSLDGTVLLEKLPSKHLEKVKVTLTEYYRSLLNTLHRLIPAPSKWRSSDPCNVNDVVLFLDGEGMKYDTWKYGRICEVAVNGKASKLRITYRNANEKHNREVFRNPRQCVPIWKEDDIDFNTTAHFRAITAQYTYEKP